MNSNIINNYTILIKKIGKSQLLVEYGKHLLLLIIMI